MSVGLAIPAAGSGQRLGSDVPKALTTVGGATLLGHTMRAAILSGVIDVVVVAAPPGHVATIRDDLQRYVPDNATLYVTDGGTTRQESVRLALELMPRGIEIIAVHDAARCLTPPSLYQAGVAAIAAGRTAVVPALPVVDTLKQVDDDGQVVATPDRAMLRTIQTPQCFAAVTLLKAHRLADETGLSDATDDARLVEAMGEAVHVIPGHPDAFKITHPDDVRRAEAILTARQGSTS